ncbi:FAD-dependent monooxygenase [Myxococcota bacterium]|nr:FAD-dependent monooxygenase [Myxococcota bacterium]
MGGGPVGFAVAIDLAMRGRKSTIVERDAGTGLVVLAKAGSLNERSMELFRRWGIADQVAGWGCPDDYPRDTSYCTALTGHMIGTAPLECVRDRIRPESTPEINRKCPQSVLDPLLAKIADETGLVEILYNTSFEGFKEDESGVLVTLRDLRTDSTSIRRSPYLVGCDGAASAVRSAAGIAFEGETLDYSVSALVRIEGLENYHPLGRAERFLFIGPNGTWANLTSVDLMSLWRFTSLGADTKLSPEELDLSADLERGFGRDDIPYEILRNVPWRRSQCAAETFRRGRVLLAGDSAHTTSPTGGHGLNTGLGDAAGLGWVLDAMLAGWGGDAMLDAYSSERRSVAIRNSSASTRNYRAWVGGVDYTDVEQDGAHGDAVRKSIAEHLDASLFPEWHSYGVAMGYRYDESPIVIPDGTKPTEDDPSTYIQTARPGHRAPHCERKDGTSTIDLFGEQFILLCFDRGAKTDRLLSAAASCSMPIRRLTLDEPETAALYERKLVLVRPDGHVAWRGDALPSDDAALSELVDRVRGAR